MRNTLLCYVGSFSQAYLCTVIKQYPIWTDITETEFM